MKKHKACILILTTLMMFVLLSGCGTGSANENESLSNSTTDDIEIDDNQDNIQEVQNNIMNLEIGKYSFTATLVDNSTTKALKEMLAKGPITIDMRDYGDMEKVGSLGTNLPRNDEQITTEPGDLILYQGNAFVIYYAPNSWNFTRIGKIDDVTQEELKEALGNGDVKGTLSLD